ncbi:MAG: hypothetical protein U1E60_11420 [Reyranellaceae bacterium]
MAIGTALRVGLREHWRHLRLTDVRPVPDPAANEEVIVADIADRSAIEGMMRLGMAGAWRLLPPRARATGSPSSYAPLRMS